MRSLRIDISIGYEIRGPHPGVPDSISLGTQLPPYRLSILRVSGQAAKIYDDTGVRQYYLKVDEIIVNTSVSLINVKDSSC
jgi:hypothetical protein